MIEYKTTELHKIVAHKIGNPAAENPLVISKSCLVLDLNTNNILKNYFLAAFKSEEYFQFFDETDVNLNETYISVKKIFDNPENLYEQSTILANNLYELSNNEKIHEGELYVAYFKDIHIQNELVDAIGLFKTESKDNFITVTLSDDGLDVLCDVGTITKKMDRAVLILNLEAENGYYLNLINKGNQIECDCWEKEFLAIAQRKDACYKTQNMLNICKNYFENQMNKDFDVQRIDQVDLLNRTAEYFKEKDKFNLNKFKDEVIGLPEVSENFSKFKENFQEEFEVELDDDFAISDYAVKKQARYLKSIIKLDKNFHIYVHGNKRNIEQGTDDNGKFYKLYYKEES